MRLSDWTLIESDVRDQITHKKQYSISERTACNRFQIDAESKWAQANAKPNKGPQHVAAHTTHRTHDAEGKNGENK